MTVEPHYKTLGKRDESAPTADTPSPYSVAERVNLALENDTLRRERNAARADVERLQTENAILRNERDEARALF